MKILRIFLENSYHGFMCYIALLNMVIEIVDFPIEKWWIFPLGYVSHYQRVSSFGLNGVQAFQTPNVWCNMASVDLSGLGTVQAPYSGINSPEQRAELGLMLRSVFPRLNLIGGLGHGLYFSIQLGSTTSQ